MNTETIFTTCPICEGDQQLSPVGRLYFCSQCRMEFTPDELGQPVRSHFPGIDLSDDVAPLDPADILYH